jgi:predicted rRNA methylase YqxC with S4 and FtsJ domains
MAQNKINENDVGVSTAPFVDASIEGEGEYSEAIRQAVHQVEITTRIDGKPFGHKPNEDEIVESKKTTTKMKLFASAIAEGLSPPEAYRKVYDCSNSTNATVMANANRLLNDSRITLLLEPVFQAKREMVINDELATRRFIMQELFEHAKNTDKVSDKLRALEMMGKSIGMFNDTGDKDENDLDVEKLKGELKAKMASMLNVTLPSAKH